MCRDLEVRKNMQSQQVTLRLVCLLQLLAPTYQVRLPRRQASEGTPLPSLRAPMGHALGSGSGQIHWQVALPAFFPGILRERHEVGPFGKRRKA